ncbi:MAG TPA: hypothetical protein VH369_09135 [Bryobacteraceae bacterium]|jgi:hypothetical protein
MKWFLLIAVLAGAKWGLASIRLLLPNPTPVPSLRTSVVEGVSEDDLIARIAASGRCVSVAETPDSRVGPGLRIAPGPPPLVSFRYYQGKLHQRFGNSDLMLDDAGH